MSEEVTGKEKEVDRLVKDLRFPFKLLPLFIKRKLVRKIAGY